MCRRHLCKKRDFAIRRSFAPQKGHIVSCNSKRNFIKWIAAFKFTLQFHRLRIQRSNFKISVCLNHALRLCIARVREPLDWKMSFRSRLAYITRGKINFCAVKFYAATSPPSRSPSYLPSYRSVFSNALEFQQSYVLMQNLSTYRGLRRMKFCCPS